MKHKFRWVNDLKRKEKQPLSNFDPSEWYKYLREKGAFK